MNFLNNFVDIIVSLVGNFGYMGVFIAVFLEYACLPLPSEVLLPFVGLLAATGKISLIGAIFVSVLGGILGSLTCYAIGYFGGSLIIESLQRKFPSSRKSISKINHFIIKYQKSSVFLTRLVPLTRTYISLVVGTLKFNIITFILYSLGGIILWNTLLIVIGYFLGENTQLISRILKDYSFIIIALIIIFCIYILYKKFLKKRRK
ncbi:DedA family protein [Clostridium sp.]|uniref:DedA family protein n=1 Tax=Clostridium sp. TaxID=1506 RepID=UPI0026DC64D1|nr:DedA family protein [Clostridium sp.]MDO5039548.1 DedA family protein [Clostridium sp.]